jgi:hypothetical protein
MKTELPWVNVQMTADRKKWRAIDGSKTPSTTKETPISSRQDIWAHLLKFGLTVHIGIGAMPSKTEAMFFPPPGRSYSEADTSRLGALDGTGNAIGCAKLRYDNVP